MNGLINNEWDRDNLNFLLNLQDSEMQDWYEQSDSDDRLYAQELLDAYSAELRELSLELRIEAELIALNDFKEAKEIIGRVKNA